MTFCIEIAFAQPLITSDASALIKKISDKYKSLRTYSDIEKQLITIKTGSEVKNTEVDIQVIFEQPNKFIYMFQQNQLILNIISDGTSLYEYLPLRSEYTKTESPLAINGLISALSDLEMSAIDKKFISIILSENPDKTMMNNVTDVQLLADEEINGIAMKVILFKQPTSEFKLLIDSQNNVIRKMILTVNDMFEYLKETTSGAKLDESAASREKLKSISLKIEWIVRKLFLNTKLAEDTFKFIPPESAKKVALLSVSEPTSNEQIKKGNVIIEKEQIKPKVSKASAGNAPKFSLETLYGNTFNLDDLNGKIVILDFWATWCPPCRKELPLINEFYNSYGNTNDVILLTVNSENELQKVKDFIKEKNYDFPVLLDNDGKVASEYGVEGIPCVFVIDKDGNIDKKYLGYDPEIINVLESDVQRLRQ